MKYSCKKFYNTLNSDQNRTWWNWKTGRLRSGKGLVLPNVAKNQVISQVWKRRRRERDAGDEARTREKVSDHLQAVQQNVRAHLLGGVGRPISAGHHRDGVNVMKLFCPRRWNKLECLSFPSVFRLVWIFVGLPNYYTEIVKLLTGPLL